MAIQVEIWQADIVANLFKDNTFLNYVFNADQYVLAGKVVHVPQTGVSPKVVKNRTNLPATVTRRSDTEVTYVLDEYTSDPVHIPDADTVELSYDKRQSVLTDSREAINETVADEILTKWVPTQAKNILQTSGDAVPASAPSATGTRKSVTLKDISNIQALMNSQKVPKADRYAMLPSYMYQQLVEQMTEAQFAAFSRAVDEKEGIVGKLYGFTFFERATVLVLDEAGAVKATDDPGAATDNEAALFWQKNSLERALGEVKFFENIGDATYYGDIYSALVRMGGRVRRADERGVAMLVQAPTA